MMSRVQCCMACIWKSIAAWCEIAANLARDARALVSLLGSVRYTFCRRHALTILRLIMRREMATCRTAAEPQKERLCTAGIACSCCAVSYLPHHAVIYPCDQRRHE